MTNLLSAGFARLRRDKLFWLCVAAALVFSALNMVNAVRLAVSRPDMSDYYTMDSAFFNLAPMLGLVTSIFSSLFLGTEYSDGVIRNKLIAGHQRVNVYLSSLAVSTAAALFMALAGILGGLSGLPHFGGFIMGWRHFAVYIGVYLLSVISICSILTAFQMSISGKAASAVSSMVLFLAILMLSSYIYNSLCAPEMVCDYMLTVDGIQVSEPHPNPEYIGGVTRQVYQLLLNILPSGQQILTVHSELTEPVADVVSSLIVTSLSTLAGILAFRKKDIK